MPRLLKRQINHLITYREGTYEVLHALKQHITAEDKTEEKISNNYQYMVNVLTDIDFFRSLGGKELLTYTIAPLSMDTLHLQVRSISPDRKQEIRRIFTLKFVSPAELARFINLK